jgi:hypothetical protein
MWSGVSDEARRAFASREYLQLVAHRLPAVQQHETDLWTGVAPVALSDDGSGDAIEAAADEISDGVEQTVDPASAAAGDRLLAALRSRRTYLLIYQEYLKRSPKSDFAELLGTLIGHTQEVIALLSSALRRIDRNPMRAGVNDKLLGQGASRKVAAGKLNFIILGAANNLDWYTEQLERNDPPAIKAIWQTLAEIEAQDLQMSKRLLALIEEATSQGSGSLQV